ncbi:hypothetical protein ABH982_002201 [Bradyrhizobium ottawaense]
MTSLGSYTCATTRMLSSLAVNGVLLAFCETRATLAPEHWTSKRNGNPAIERLAQS